MANGVITTPRATYRVQLHAGFGFEAAAALTDYLRDLGVSHLYTSPCFQATPGSMHGYDVTDPGRVSRELGGTQGHQHMVASLRGAGLGLMVDIVPNHMAVGSADNAWWWDVLENGPSSAYAHYFDVDWKPPQESLANKVLLPVLGDHYGRVIEAGQIAVKRDGARFEVRYFEHRYPCASRALDQVLHRAAERLSGTVADEVGFIADAFGALPAPTPSDVAASRRRHRDKEVLHGLLGRLLDRHPEVGAAIDEGLRAIDADPDQLDALLDNQNYRLAYWRTAGQALDYRRFFDIHSLAALRVEDPEVFEDTHWLVLDWVRTGVVDGLRVDHIDGLRDPEGYLRTLRASGPEHWIVVEKILEPEEHLPTSWPVEGTTGYEFMNLALGVLVDAAAREPLTRLYDEIAGERVDYRELVAAAKAEVLRDALGSEINRLSELAARACERHRRHRDHTRHELRETLIELIARFPVYRTYVRETTDELRDEDRLHLEHALAAVREHRPELDSELITFFGNLLSLRWRGDVELELAMRFQQVSGPAMAKGVEDTAFYRYARFVALNEVGGDPGRFGVDVARFHQEMQRAAGRPRSLNATSTHDTKRSEDVRARLAVLTEMPDRWAEQVRAWWEHNRQHTTDGMPDRNTEYLYYQNLVGAWPIDADRMTAYMIKAAREAKRHTAWTRIDERFEAALTGFVAGTLGDDWFRDSVDAFVAELREPGRVNSLAQKLLALTAPGVPDLYQGTELWDLSLVDPDNRRPVDFDARRDLLAAVDRLSPEEILARGDEGLPKLWLVRQALRLRAQRPDAFAGDYAPLAATGAAAHRVIAYSRGGGAVAVVVPRLPRAGRAWGDTEVSLPAGELRDELTGEVHAGGPQPVAALLARFPVALLARIE